MDLKKEIQNKKIKVWVFSPQVEVNDENLEYYYDFSQSIQEYTNVFKILKLDWFWQPINLLNLDEILNSILQEDCFPIVLNLCDGDEINGAPGISVIKKLNDLKIVHTGSDEFFFKITTSKITMKLAFEQFNVPTPPWLVLNDMPFDNVFQKLGDTVILKPAVSAGSLGVGINNVVETYEQLKKIYNEIKNGYKGWNLCLGGLILESFIKGPEYTVFITGTYDDPQSAKVYPPIERCFHDSLPENEKFLSFDRLWEIYESESPLPMNEKFYEYKLAPLEHSLELKKISWAAFVATKGTGYTRVDLRMDSRSKKIYVLELNAQCGISEDENFTSIGAILRFSNTTFSDLIHDILIEALKRAKKLKYY